MDTLSHFVLAVFAGLVVCLHRERGLGLVVFAGFCSVLIDLDHFLVPLGFTGEYRLFHNVFFVFLLPCVLFLVSFFFGRGSFFGRLWVFFLLLCVMLSTHVVCDMVGECVPLFYPVWGGGVSLPDVDVQATGDFDSTVVDSHGICLAVYALIVFIGVFVYDTFYHLRHKRLGLGDALRCALGEWL